MNGAPSPETRFRYGSEPEYPFLTKCFRVLAKCAGWRLDVFVAGSRKPNPILSMAFTGLGQAFGCAINGHRGNVRGFGCGQAPSGDSLARACVDITSHSIDAMTFIDDKNTFDPHTLQNAERGLEIFAAAALVNLRFEVLEGKEPKHCARAAFAAVGMALKLALEWALPGERNPDTQVENDPDTPIKSEPDV